MFSTAVQCPECGCRRLYKDGLRTLVSGGTIQRWLCRSCGYRFSFGHTVSKTNSPISVERQICVSLQGAKNLTSATETKTVAGTSPTPDTKGQIVGFAWYLKKEGYREGTIHARTKTLETLVKRGADLLDPDSVKEAIAKQTWGDTTKLNASVAYKRFTEYMGIAYKPPKYRASSRIPFIPLEREVDQLIASTGKKTATFLQLLKETGMRCGEAWRVTWEDANLEARTVSVNHPEKHSNARMLKISEKLVSMLNRLPKTRIVFGGKSLDKFRNNFMSQRKTAARKLGNPRLEHISFHTLRHFKATMEFQKTHNILHVMRTLGHKNINNTMIYTHLVNFESDDYHVNTAKTVKEACELVKAGFEYVTEMDACKIFRKRK